LLHKSIIWFTATLWELKQCAGRERFNADTFGGVVFLQLMPLATVMGLINLALVASRVGMSNLVPLVFAMLVMQSLEP
jgi:hypothetical protein